MNLIRITLLCVVCLTSLTLFFQMKTSSILPQNAKKWFGLAFCGIMTAAIAEYIGDRMNGDAAHITLHIIIKLTEFFITPWLPVLMAMACNAVRKPKIVLSLLFLHMLAEVILVFSGSVFYISPDGIYHHGPLYFIYGGVFSIAFLYLLAVLVLLSQRYRKYHRLNLLLSALILLAGLIPALIDSSCRTSFLGISLSSFVLYTYYEGLTQQQLAEDLEKRNQLINRMQGRIIEGIADLIENRDSNTGTHIPLSARIMALADVYDALIMKRPYKDAFSTEKALGIIEEGLGSHFDPELGKLFVETMRNLNAE